MPALGEHLYWYFFGLVTALAGLTALVQALRAPVSESALPQFLRWVWSLLMILVAVLGAGLPSGSRVLMGVGGFLTVGALCLRLFRRPGH